MLISPKHAIEQGWITLPEGVNLEKTIQPNAIDFTLDRMFQMATDMGGTIITESERKFPEFHELDGSNGWCIPGGSNGWCIPALGMVDCMSNFTVNIPEGVAAQLVVRSSFGRAGIILTSGLYDSGFKGNIGFTLFNRSSLPVFTAPGTRVGQIIFMPSVSVGTYNGVYNNKTDFWGGKVNGV
jgi:dUTP pyrophosphatase